MVRALIGSQSTRAGLGPGSRKMTSTRMEKVSCNASPMSYAQCCVQKKKRK